MTKKPWLFGLIAVAVVVIAWFVGTYNGLVRLEGEIDGQWAQVENNLQRRYDLIPNLVSTVKGYAQHEEDIFTAVAEARAKLAGGNLSVSETASATNELTGALGRLLAIAEAYPELKANENFLNLQDELAGTENRLAVSRKDYNESVKTFNVKIKTIPTNIVAGVIGAQSRDFFEIDEVAQENVKVDFSD
ncbi:MAG: LemA family protein [Candidatus Moranbacteria bacterium]|nr:LemA family protein [Candidatus Moranbacteria bacterium]